jgi:hypothetical protein
MNDARYFLLLDGAVNGPYRDEQVRELAVGQVVNARTPVARDAAGPWQPLADVPELTTIIPPLALAAAPAASVERVNEPGARGVDLRELIAAAQVKGPVLGGSGRAVPAAAAKESVGPLNDVQELVRSVQATEAKFAAPLPLPKRRPVSRSAKTVAALWLLMMLGVLAFRLGYASRWTELSTNILMGWLVLGHGLLAALYFLFRRTESEAR